MMAEVASYRTYKFTHWRAKQDALEQYRRVVNPLMAAGRVDMARRAARAYKQRLARIAEFAHLVES